jgi:hypothetical protein
MTTKKRVRKRKPVRAWALIDSEGAFLLDLDGDPKLFSHKGYAVDWAATWSTAEPQS